MRHSGREFGLVLSGTLSVTVGFDDHVLGPGDSITFQSTTPHRLRNDGADRGPRDLGHARPLRRRVTGDAGRDAVLSMRAWNGVERGLSVQ